MAITDPLILAADLVLVPVADLPEAVRERVGASEGDWALTRRRARTPSRIVDARSAELLAEFRTPSTVAEAVLRFTRDRDTDPEETLAAAFPLLERLHSAGFLVEEGGTVGPQPWAAGEEVAGYEIAELLQGYEDVEVYRVRGPDGPAVLKVARPKRDRHDPRGEPSANVALVREAAALSWLAAGGEPIAPRLLAAGEIEARRWLAVEWCPGTDAATAAAELRRAGGPEGERAGDRAGLLALAVAIARAYAALHARGLLHGDVHPRNVRVSPDGAVRLLDLGLARWLEPEAAEAAALGEPGRGGVGFYFEPEYAAAARSGRRPPPVTPAGEQHAVAALLYLLLAGAHPHDFSLEKTEMLRQIAEEPPLPFAERGAEPWPEAEAVLARALAKDPGRRFASTADLAVALAAVPSPHPADSEIPLAEPEAHPAAPTAASPAGPRSSGAGPAARALLARVLEKLGPGAEASPQPPELPAPRASVRAGAAGIACGLYRIALAREDPELLAHADLWAARAEADGGAGAFDAPGLPPERAGRVSPYHAAPGPPCVAAFVAHARGDGVARREAIGRTLALLREALREPPPAELDLGLGLAGTLAACALLLDPLPPDDPRRAELKAVGEEVLADLWKQAAALPSSLPPVRWEAGTSLGRHDAAIPRETLNLGLAHGWAGLAWAALRWCHAAGTTPPPGLAPLLADLARRAEPGGRGLRWRWFQRGGRESRPMPGWCNGSAGFVHLWLLAHRAAGDPTHRALAEGAAWDAWESPDRDPTLCCGLAGRAYALLALWRASGGREWLGRARDLAERAAEQALRRDSQSQSHHRLYQGDLGIAVLAADLERPETAAMPCFEEEGWPRSARR